MSEERLRGERDRSIRTASRLALDVAERDSLITEYKAEIERLHGIVQFGETASRQQREGFQAEIERLKAALRYARDCASGHVDNKCFDCRELVAHIDAALEKKPHCPQCAETIRATLERKP